MRRDFFVEIALPIEPLGDRLDHEIAFGEAREVAAVIGGLDGRCAVLGCQRCRLQLGETRDGFDDEPVGVAVFGGQVVQQRRDAGVGQVRGDLRTHHTGAENGGFAQEDRRS